MQRRKLKNDELGRLPVEAFRRSEKSPVILVLDDVRSLNNVGSVFRTADAFRVEKIYLCGITGTPPHKDIRKTALGACESVAWEYAEDVNSLVERLKSEGVVVVSVEQAEGSVSLTDFRIDGGKKTAFVFGNEVKGVHQEVVNRSDVCVEIPQYGTKHSFNISVSVGIVLWDAINKLKWRG